MDHVAIMNPAWRLIPKILSGEKSIESRWYQTRRTPWDRAAVGESIYFKDSGRAVIARARIVDVLQFEIGTFARVRQIVGQYGHAIGLVQPDPADWDTVPRYCILLKLADPELVVPPFLIDKTGFGTGAAWLTIDSIARIRVALPS